MKTFLKTVFLCLLIFLGASCSQKKADTATKPTIVVSVAPYKYFVDKISNGKIETLVLVPSYANPHAYEPSPKLVEQSKKAKLWFIIGENFEEKVAKALPIQKIDLRENIKLIEDSCCHGHHHHHKTADVHTWLSPKIAKQQSLIIKNALIEAFPEYKSEFEKSALDLDAELSLLDNEVEVLLKNATSKNILVSHPAFAYLCRDYGVFQFSIEQEGKEPTIKHLIHLKEEAKAKNFKLILIQAQHDNKGALRLSKELGIPSTLIDPYSPDYTNNIRKIAHIISQCEDR